MAFLKVRKKEILILMVAHLVINVVEVMIAMEEAVDTDMGTDLDTDMDLDIKINEETIFLNELFYFF